MSDKVRRVVKPGGKSLVIFAFGVVALVSGLIACSDTPARTVAPANAVAADEAPPAANPHAFVGEGHNAMVDAVLRDVAKKRVKQPSQKKLCKMVQESAIEYARVHAKNPGAAVAMVRAQDFCATPGGSALAAKAHSNIAEESGLSYRAIELLNSADYLMSIAYSASLLEAYLAPLNYAALTELDWEEAQVVTSANSVAVSSLAYWDSYLASWQGEFGSGQTAYLTDDSSIGDARMTPRYSRWGDVWDILKADFEGAVSGGVGAKLAKAAIPEAALWIGGSKSLIRFINKL